MNHNGPNDRSIQIISSYATSLFVKAHLLAADCSVLEVSHSLKLVPSRLRRAG